MIKVMKILILILFENCLSTLLLTLQTCVNISGQNVGIVIDYVVTMSTSSLTMHVDTVSAKLLTTRTQQWLFRHQW